jgi:predicted DsbA family dithiol-disulfide isomerase
VPMSPNTAGPAWGARYIGSVPAEPIVIDLFADIACPWCYIGRRRLERVLAERPADATPVVVKHRAFQLDPTIPDEGVPAAEYFARRFGDPETIRTMHERVTAAAADTDIEFDFDARPTLANTNAVHRAIVLASQRGAEDAAVDAMYRATFTEGLDLTDHATIVRRLAEAGVPDTDGLFTELEAGGGAEQVDLDLQLGRDLEITGVPLMVGDRQFGMSGAQPTETVVEFLAHVERARDGA